MGGVRRISFIVRVVQDQAGEATGIIERVATGTKEAFTAADAIGRIILEMLRFDAPAPTPSPTAVRPDRSLGGRQRDESPGDR